MIPETFKVLSTRDDESLIGPEMGVGNHSWKDWGLRWLRSMHVNSDDQSIISVGFPKFMNMGEGCGTYNVSETELLKMGAGGTDLYATLKIDGTLLIRYVKDGEVRWRTRGSLQVGLDNASEIDEFIKQNPKLGDPTLYAFSSVLFEWATPTNRIVLGYPEPKLYLIGGVNYIRDVPWCDAKPALFNIPALKDAAIFLEVETTPIYPLASAKEVEKLIADLKNNTEIEGFVIRFDNGQRLTKVKTEHYFTLHALRSNLTTSKLVELWLQWDKPNYQEYADKFEMAYDYECWEWALPAVSSMYDGVRQAQNCYTYVQKFVETNRHLGRKEFALASQERFNGLQLALCFSLLDGKEVKDDFWLKMILRNCKQVEIKMIAERPLTPAKN